MTEDEALAAPQMLQALVDGPRHGEVFGVRFDLRHPDLPDAQFWHAPTVNFMWGLAFPWDGYGRTRQETAYAVTNGHPGEKAVTFVDVGDEVKVYTVKRFRRSLDEHNLADEKDMAEYWALLEVLHRDGSTEPVEETLAFVGRDAVGPYSDQIEYGDDGFDQFVDAYKITFEKIVRRAHALAPPFPYGDQIWRGQVFHIKSEWLSLAIRLLDSAADDADQIDDRSPLGTGSILDAAVAAGYALAMAEAELRTIPLARSGLKAKASLERAVEGARARGNPIRLAARADIRANPMTSQGACAGRVAKTLGRLDVRSVTRIIAPMFEWVSLPGGIREKRPKAQALQE